MGEGNAAAAKVAAISTSRFAELGTLSAGSDTEELPMHRTQSCPDSTAPKAKRKPAKNKTVSKFSEISDLVARRESFEATIRCVFHHNIYLPWSKRLKWVRDELSRQVRVAVIK